MRPQLSQKLGSWVYRRLLSTTASLSATPTKTTPTEKPGTGTGIVRDARQDDYDDVMSISHDIYGGRDYLPCLFPQFVQNNDIHSYVYEIDGTVVGFEAAHVIDGGATIVTRGARVRSDYQGLGIVKILRNHLMSRLGDNHTVRCISMTTSNTTGLATKPSVVKTNKEIFKRDVHVFPYESAKIDCREEDDFRTEVLEPLTVSNLCDAFKDSDLRKYLFPHDRIIINTIPFRLMPENAEHIQYENPYIIASEKLIKPSNRSRLEETGGILSMTTWFSCKAGICADLEFYGKSSNFKELCNHIGRHLRHIQHLADHGHLMVPHSRTISTDVLLCAMYRYGLYPMNSPFKTQYLFEQDLHSSGHR